jgi:hypothetical protein
VSLQVLHALFLALNKPKGYLTVVFFMSARIKV